jgi:hypothetical protein
MIKSNNIDKFQCSICYLVMTNPIEIELCSHSFCDECLKKFINSVNHTPSCPLCKNKFNEKNLIENKLLEKEIDMKEIICDCSEQIKLKNYNNHLTKCNNNKNSIIHKKIIPQHKIEKEKYI